MESITPIDVPRVGCRPTTRPPEPSEFASLENWKARCHALRCAKARTQLSIASTAAHIAALEVAQAHGYSSLRDYVRGRLGVSWSRAMAWSRVGRLLQRCPFAAQWHLSGQLSFEILDELARAPISANDAKTLLPAFEGRSLRETRLFLKRLREDIASPEAASNSEQRTTEQGHDHGRSSDGAQSGIDPGYCRVSFVVPAPVARYAHDTLRLAQAQRPHDAPEDQQLAAVLAEASTEIAPTVSVDEARRQFQWKPISARRPDSSARTHLPPGGSPASPLPAARFSNPRTRLVLDRWMRRQLHRRSHIDALLEDALLEMSNQAVHQRCGFQRLEQLAAHWLGLAPTTANDKLRRARLRRANDPVAQARAQGQLSTVKADLLQRLSRWGVPRSALHRWIHHAADLDTRELRRCVSWARLQVGQDHIRWSRDGFAPPDCEQLRTTNQPIETIAQDPDPPEFIHAAKQPTLTLSWCMESEALDLLLQLVSSIAEQKALDTGHRPPTWWCLLRIFHLARKAWAPLAQLHRDPRHRVLHRDHWICAVPECTARNNLHGHHLEFRSQGGGNELDNLITLCAQHHQRGVHGGLLRIKGKATDGGRSLQWELGRDEAGRPTELFRGYRRVEG